MKKSFILLQASIIVLMLTFISFKASAQFFSGPSDNTTAPPTTTAAVDGFVCLGGVINLTGQGDPADTYRWYKKALTTGTITLVQGPGAAGANTYTETSTTAGYYTYYVEEINPNGCISPMSNAINIYVLPSATPVIAGAAPYCANLLPANLDLSITGLDPAFTYTYQWSKNGTNISGATGPTYRVTEIIANTYNYRVRVTFVLSSGLTLPCTYTSLPATITVYPVPLKPSIQVN